MLTVVVHRPALDVGFIVDDDVNVTENSSLRDADGLRRIWTDPTANQQFYPLTYTSFWLQYRISGTDPYPYHLVNVLLHAAAAVLLGLTLRKLEVPWGWLAATWFAVHPAQVESVVWITERRNVLSGVLYILAALSYFRFALPTSTRSDPRARTSAAILAVLLFAAALLAKTAVATLPFVLALVLWWKTGSVGRREAGPLIAMAALALAAGLITLSVERSAVGADGPLWDLPLVERILVAGRAVFFYLGKLALPVGLSLNYPRWEIDPTSASAYLFPAFAVGGLLGLFLLRARIGRGPFVAFASFAITLAPVLGFFNVFYSVYSFVADRWVYLAAIAPMALAAAGAGRAASLGRVPRAAVSIFALATVVTLGALAHRQASLYRSSETLWLHVLETNPGSWMARLNLGRHYERTGDFARAVEEYERAVEACPFPLEYAHLRLAELHTLRGDFGEAERHHRRVLEVTVHKDRAHVNLGNFFADLARTAEAEEHYRAALAIDDDSALAHYNYATILGATGRRDEAIRQYREAIRCDPRLAAAHNNLAALLFEAGRYEEARREAETCLRKGGRVHPDLLYAIAERLR